MVEFSLSSLCLWGSANCVILYSIKALRPIESNGKFWRKRKELSYIANKKSSHIHYITIVSPLMSTHKYHRLQTVRPSLLLEKGKHDRLDIMISCVLFRFRYGLIPAYNSFSSTFVHSRRRKSNYVQPCKWKLYKKKVLFVRWEGGKVKNSYDNTFR